MVRLLWLLLEEGKHVKGVQGVKLHNSDCQWYVLLKQCLLARSLFNLIIFPKDRSIRHVDTRDTSQNWLWKEYLLRNIFKSFVIGLPIIFLNLNRRNVCPGVHLVDERFMLEYEFVSCRIKGYENMFFRTWSTLEGLSQSTKPSGEVDKVKKAPEWLSNELLKQCHWYY